MDGEGIAVRGHTWDAVLTVLLERVGVSPPPDRAGEHAVPDDRTMSRQTHSRSCLHPEMKGPGIRDVEDVGPVEHGEVHRLTGLVGERPRVWTRGLGQSDVGEQTRKETDETDRREAEPEALRVRIAGRKIPRQESRSRTMRRRNRPLGTDFI
jgi:hypothetical protein